MVAQNIFHRASSHQITDLWRFADGCNIPWNLPTNFHSDLIATKKQRCLPLLCALLFQQSHLFMICVGKICQILGNYQCKWLWDSASAPRTFASSFQFPDECLFCTDKIESIELPSLASILLVLSLLLNAGCCEETSASFDEDVGEVGKKFSVLQIIRIPSSMRCGFWPLIHS